MLQIDLTAAQLLALHAEIVEELRSRGIVRSANNPTGDLAEHLFCKAFGWEQAANSEASFDATASNGDRFQIKARRLLNQNGSRQLSALRQLPNAGFDFLAAVLFAKDYTVARAIIIPHERVLDNSQYNEHTNSWRFLLQDSAWEWQGVEDVTNQLRAVEL